MKEGIHPNYREVCFVDLSNGFKFVTRSCASTKEMIKMEDGRELPMYKLDTSSESHPFYTGTQKSVDNMGGRVEKFRNRFGKTPVARLNNPAPSFRQGQPGSPRCPFALRSMTTCFTPPFGALFRPHP
jgi:large subunit ribosomal protein L31